MRLLARTLRTIPAFFGMIALGVAGCGPAPLEPREPTAGVPHFSVATFNVHFPTAGDTKTTEAVGRTGADLVFLQETDAAWRTALTARYSAAYPYMEFSVDEGPRGLAVLSRYRISEYRLLEAPNDWHPGARVVIETPAGALQVLHVHLRSKFEGESNPVSDYFATGRDHVLEMKHFFEALTPMPTLVVGDFNEEPGEGALGFLEARGFHNALPLFHPGQWTWKGRSVADQFALTIDHVLFDGSFAPLNARISENGNSDHHPVVAHFELAPRQTGAPSELVRRAGSEE